MEAAGIMKKYALILDTEINPCMVGASIKMAFSEYDMAVAFSKEEYLNDVIDEITDADFIIIIGYSEDPINEEKLKKIEDKLLLLSPFDKEDGSTEFIPALFAREFDEETFDFINVAISASSNWETISLLINNDKEELTNIDTVDESTVEGLQYARYRYLVGLEIVENIYNDLGKEVEFHIHYFMELINADEDGWINELLKKSEYMQRETKKLITYLRPLGKEELKKVAYVTTENCYFFSDDICDEAEKKGYKTLVIQLKNPKDEYMTLITDCTRDDKKVYLGKLETNLDRITEKLN